MNELPELFRLSESDKDALIRALWAQVEELREEAASCRFSSAISASCSAIRACSWAIIRSWAATSAASCS